MFESMKDKIAVITGAASGIGYATTKALLEAEAKVVMVDWNEKDLKKKAEDLGGNVITQFTNLLDGVSCASMIPEILKKTGQIDILHCNAGSYIGCDLDVTDSQNIDQMLNLNVNAVMKNVTNIIPHMKERGVGDIIGTCSVAGHTATHWEPVYSSSKWAITCFVQTMRRQLMGHGIRVGQVSPGPVLTALLKDWPKENLEKAKEKGALIDPEEIADAVMYMLTRKRTVTIRDRIILTTNFDI